MSDQTSSFESATESAFDSRRGPIRAVPPSGHAPDLAMLPASPSDGYLHLSHYIRVLYKRRHLAMTMMAVIVLSVAAYSFTATRIYEAKTRLLIQPDEQNVVSFKKVVEEDEGKPDYYQTQYNVLQSRALARKTLAALGLFDHGPFIQTTPSLVRQITNAPKALMSKWLADDAQAEPRASNETAIQSRAIDAFLAALVITPVRNSRLVDVSMRLPDAKLATQLVNEHARNYIQQDLDYKFSASKDASDWLGKQLAEQGSEVQRAEAALQRYRENNDAISREDRENIVVQKLTDLNAAVTKAKTERIEKEALYQQLQQAQSNPAVLDTFPAILSNAFIQQQKSELAQLQRQQAQLGEKFGDRHPDMQRLRSAIQLSEAKLNGEIAKVVQGVRSEYQAALAQENSLNSALNQQKGDAMAMNRKAIEYGVLERDVESSRQVYQALLQRSKETGVSGDLKTSNLRVLDVAETPRNPVSPRTGSNMLLALLGGTLFSCGLAFLVEYLDSRIKTPEEIRQYLGIPHLGLLPVIKGAVGSPLITAGVPGNFGEALRVIRTNVLFSWADEGPRAILVTSTGPGEGKSLVASNLALSLAQAGQRVLLIDADLRRPKVHEAFNIAAEPGLSNVMVGNAKASETIRKSNTPGLWLMPAGHLPPNPAELVGSKRFGEFLLSLGDHFDTVIFDSPPVMAVTDAALIAHRNVGVLFVVGAEMTSHHAARHAIEHLDGAGARFLGAVLNRVDLDRHGYYYAQYYRREYSEYYRARA